MAEPGHISSEEMNPFGAMIVGRLFARVTSAKQIGDAILLEHAYAELWYGVKALNRLAIAVKTATHFSIAAGNHLRDVRELCIADTGLDPEKQWAWN